MHRDRRCDLEQLLPQPYQAPALLRLTLDQAAQPMQDLVGAETQQQVDLIARHDVLYRGGATIRRREMHVEGRLQLAHVGLGLAALAVQRQDLLRRVVELVEVGDQEERMKQQVVGILLHDQHHAAR